MPDASFDYVAAPAAAGFHVPWGLMKKLQGPNFGLMHSMKHDVSAGAFAASLSAVSGPAVGSNSKRDRDVRSGDFFIYGGDEICYRMWDEGNSSQWSYRIAMRC